MPVRPVSRLSPVALIALLHTAPAAAAELAPGFVEAPIAVGLDRAIQFAFDPSGTAWVVSQPGVVTRVDPDGFTAEVLDLTDEVNGEGNRGLIGVAVDPDFDWNGHIYLLYTVDPAYGEPDEGPRTAALGRLTRYTVLPGGEVDLGSRKVLLGDDAGLAFPMCSISHHVGHLDWGLDGALYISAGDGAHYDYYADYGQDLTTDDQGCESTFGADQDIGAFRSQAPFSLGGKILRVDPQTARGLPDNPLYTGDPDDAQSRIWASGLRNPYRFAVDPVTGHLWIGDVGEARYEELNFAAGGENFGWPCYEGPLSNTQYFAVKDLSFGCASIETGANPGPLTGPALAWHHSDAALLTPDDVADRLFTGSTSTAGDFSSPSWPGDWGDALFFADFIEGWIRAAVVDEVDVGDALVGEVVSVATFATDVPGPVAIRRHPISGDLVYLSVYTGALMQLSYDPRADQPPLVSLSAGPTEGSAPFRTTLSAAGSYDPEGTAITCTWALGDGRELSGCEVSPTWATSGAYVVTLTVTDATGQSSTETLPVLVDRSAPVATILAPVDGSEIGVPGAVTLRATATDDDHALSELSFSWTVYLQDDVRYFPSFYEFSGPETTVTLAGVDLDGYVRFELTVTDPDGLTDTVSTTVWPDNAAPAFTDPGPQVVTAGDKLTLQIQATDPDGDAVELGAVSLPAGAAFDGDSGAFSWTPTNAAAGQHRLRFRAIDVNAAPRSAELDVLVTVVPAAADTLTLDVTSDWGAGWCADLRWTNTTGAAAEDWTVVLGMAAPTLFAGWNGIFAEAPGGYVITPEWYNRSVADGDDLVIGMCGDGARPTSAELVLPGDEAGDPVDPDAFSVLVTYAEWGRWGPASCGDVSLTNSGDLPVDGWATTFTTPPGTQVGGFWVADIVELERGSYRAVDQGWNAWLAPQAGNSQIYGVCMDGSGVPTDFAFEAP